MIFSQKGVTNTKSTLICAIDAAERLGLNQFIVATCTGDTALSLIELLDERWKNSLPYQVVAVTHVNGFSAPNRQEMSEDVRKKLVQKGVCVVTAAHSMGGLGRAVRMKFGTYEVDEIIAHTLRVFGQGTKVAIEIAMMAVDAGFASTTENVIAIGGSGKGADTALVIKPANTHRFFDLIVDEIVCKPQLSKDAQ